MSVEMKWAGDQLLETLTRALHRGATQAAELYRAEIRAVINEHDNGPPSQPFTPPHGQSREALRRRITPLADTVEVVNNPADPLDVAVGSQSDYALDLEVGTRNMRPRPLWAPTAERMRDQLREEFIRAALAEFAKLGG
jgi:hypothetical protein